MSEKKAKTAERDEINRLFAALRNFLFVGFDGRYQQSESAIEQLEKLRKYTLKQQKQQRQALLNTVTYDNVMKHLDPNEVDDFTVSLVIARVRKMIRSEKA